MAVSNQYMIYQLHWEDKQLRLSKKDKKKLLDHKKFNAFKNTLLNMYKDKETIRASISKYTKLSEVNDFINKH
jgi:hypothetical protein